MSQSMRDSKAVRHKKLLPFDEYQQLKRRYTGWTMRMPTISELPHL